MTDKEIIQSFLDNNQHGIREAYYAWRVPFEQSVCYRTHLDLNYIDDAYQEAFIRLQQHILTERLTTDNIQKSLLSYLKEIGYFVAMEIINKRRELPISFVQSYDETNDQQEDNETHQILHRHVESQDIDTPENLPDEQPNEKVPIQEDNYFDLSTHIEREEHERIIRQLVEQVGPPCAPLLLGYLWENKSMSNLAQELGYSSADSAKTQKSKCMKKVIVFIKQKLIEYGYEY